MTGVCLHQPNFIPWTKLLAKIAASDVYVASTAFSSPAPNTTTVSGCGHATDRCSLRPQYARAKSRQRLCDVELDPAGEWRGYHLRVIEQEYRRAPLFTEIFPLVRDVYQRPQAMLVDFNLDLLGTFLAYLEVPTRIVKASDLPHHGDNTDRLILLTTAVGGVEHITSTWGTERKYIDWARVADAGLKIRTQQYVHPTYRHQFEPLEPHLGALDLMFAQGRAAARTVCRSSSYPYVSL